MRVSVVVPVFNKAPYIGECLESIFAQTFSDLEILAIDDRSTDESLAVLRSFSDPRLRVVALDKNLGPAGAAQRGMDLAQGEYIVRMDADDIMFPDRVERQVEFMDAHSEIGASGGDVVLFGEDTHTVFFPRTNDECKAELIFGVPISQGASIFRTSVLKGAGVRYQEDWPRVAEDWLFFLDLARHTDLGNVDAPLIHYRRGAQNIRKGQDMDEVRRKVLSLALPKLGMVPDHRNMLNHCLNIPIFWEKADRRMVRDFHLWLDEVKEINGQKGFFSAQALSDKLEFTWQKLYHYLPDHGWTPALEHMRLSGHWPMDRIIYLLKVRINALLGRSAKP